MDNRFQRHEMVCCGSCCNHLSHILLDYGTARTFVFSSNTTRRVLFFATTVDRFVGAIFFKNLTFPYAVITHTYNAVRGFRVVAEKGLPLMMPVVEFPYFCIFRVGCKHF